MRWELLCKMRKESRTSNYLYNMSKGNETAEDAVQELYRLSSYDYPLPEHLIAQQPAKQRDQSRLLVVDCVNNSRRHTLFNTLCELITPGDLLVINNTKVFPARLLGRKETGGKVETLLLHFPAQIQTKGQECQATTLALIKRHIATLREELARHNLKLRHVAYQKGSPPARQLHPRPLLHVAI